AADRRRRARRRLLPRGRAGQRQGDERELQRRGVREAAARLPLRRALQARADLPRRRPRRPRRPALAAADRRHRAVRRDPRRPPRRPRRGWRDDGRRDAERRDRGTTTAILSIGAAVLTVQSLLADRNLAGLGFGTGFNHKSLPKALVDEAEKRDFPLFEVPYSVPFIAITEKAFARLVNEQYEVLQRGIAVQRRLERLVLEER